MNQHLKDLFYSNNEEDVKLALIIARKENVNPRDVNDIFDEIAISSTIPEITGLFSEYLLTGSGYKEEHSWDYTKWKQEEGI